MEWLKFGIRKKDRDRARGRRGAVFGRALVACCGVVVATGATAAESDVSRLALEELGDIEISSVSKKAEPLSEAPAAVFVITREDIRRSGATSLPEILRMAPNLQVARVNANQYAITARGFNGTAANKLLVLIDGRSVYTPLFSGVFWEVQDVLIENIERIEVVSGPGGTLWGSNAVNGVINIIRRKASDTPGAFSSFQAGTEELGAGVRYGAKLGEQGAYRIYAKGFKRDSTVTATGASVDDSWEKGQLGFRTDFGQGRDSFTVQGDVYDGSLDQLLNDDKTVSGGNLLGRWSRLLEAGSAMQVQVYYDKTEREQPGTFAEVLDTYDLEAQHRIALGRHELVWGGGYRRYRDDVTNTTNFRFLPAQKDFSLTNIFIQGGIALSQNLELILGEKLERNDYTGTESQPNARLAWKLGDKNLLWSAVSRAVRTPSRLDRELYTTAIPPSTTSFAGGPEFESEKLIAYEVGYRAQPTSFASFSVSTFYNDYDELRSIEPLAGSPGTFIFGNKMEGHTYGVELWGSYRVSDGWRLNAGYNYLEMDLRLKPDSMDTNFGVPAASNDPAHQYILRSTLNLRHDVEFDTSLRRVGALPNPTVPSYVELDARLGWFITKDIDVSLVGTNLLDKRHPEFGAPATRGELARSFLVRAVWKF